MKPIGKIITYALTFVSGMLISAYFLSRYDHRAIEVMKNNQRDVEDLREDVSQLSTPCMANSLRYELSIIDKYIILTVVTGSLTKEEYTSKNKEIKSIEHEIDVAAGDGFTKEEVHGIQKRIDELRKEVVGNSGLDEKNVLDGLRNLEGMI
ncbi:MAG: hypothetical protein Q7J54_07570 [Candidatus Woesearchaeota archaeon]|nr:hypothetical protein [Candidatus Woesearchaeota archaeon]